MWLEITDLNISNEQKIIFENANYSSNHNCIIICGENGIGKSTLLDGIYKYCDYKGSIKLFGSEVSSISRKEITKLIGYATQGGMLYSDLKVETNLKTLGIELNSFKQYYKQFEIKQLLSKKVKDLSGGERQVVNLCIVFAKKSQCLLFDEPFNNLSVENKQIFIELISNESRKMIIVTHEMNERLEGELVTIEGRGFNV